MQNFLNLKLSSSRDSLVSQRKFNELLKNLNLTDMLIEQRNKFELNKTSQRNKLDFYISRSCYAAKLWWYFIQLDGIFIRSAYFPVSRLYFQFRRLYNGRSTYRYVHKLRIFFQFSRLFEELSELVKSDKSYLSSKVTVLSLWIRSELIGYPISMQIKRHSHKTVSLKVDRVEKS